MIEQIQCLTNLRQKLFVIERRTARKTAGSVLPFGIDAIDRHLPDGGLRLGGLHEIADAGPGQEHATAAGLMIAGILARLEGPVLWAAERADLFAPALVQAGLAADRVLHVDAPRAVPLVMEEGLRHGGFAGIVGELRRLDAVAARRLQLAAETAGVTAFALRRSRKPQDAALAAPIAAVTRWRVARLPSGPPVPEAPRLRGLAPALWRLDLIRCRGAEPASWTVEACDATGRLRLAAVMADRPLAETAGRWAAAPDSTLPVVTRVFDGRRWVIGGADAAAQAMGLRPGLPLAQAQAMRPGLTVIDADPAGDATGLRDIAVWCQRYAPLTAADPPDGIRFDCTGADHLHGGEAAMLADLRQRLARSGFTARAAVADTPGGAWALARHGNRPLVVVPPGGIATALAPLPVAALRLPAETVAALDRLGFSRVEQLAAAPRGPLVRRFGAGLMRQLDCALGTVFEPLEPVPPPTLIRQRLTFVEPLATAEAFATVIARLCRAVCDALARRGEGARRLDLVFERVDGTMQLLAVGTARPVRDPPHLARLLGERIETIDPGLGVEAMTLWVPLAEPAPAGQGDALTGAGGGGVDLAPLIDRLVARFGAAHVYRVAPVESDVPERSVARLAALSPPVVRSWPQALPRPLRLLTPPQPVEALALLPDQPPVAFTWRRVRHRVRRADGPERIFGEWWRRDGEMRAVRDYWAVEDERGDRFWLYRSGDGVAPETGNLAWFMHGIF